MARNKTINKRIVDIMEEAFLMPLFFVAGIEALKDKINTMRDEEVTSIFNNLVPAQTIRKKVDEIHVTLSDNETLIA